MVFHRYFEEDWIEVISELDLRRTVTHHQQVASSTETIPIEESKEGS
jgi:hypothetical protein